MMIQIDRNVTVTSDNSTDAYALFFQKLSQNVRHINISSYSTGVGRTGTYIAVDRLLQHIKDHDCVDVYSVILDMRQYRGNVVKTLVNMSFDLFLIVRINQNRKQKEYNRCKSKCTSIVLLIIRSEDIKMYYRCLQIYFGSN